MEKLAIIFEDQYSSLINRTGRDYMTSTISWAKIDHRLALNKREGMEIIEYTL